VRLWDSLTGKQRAILGERLPGPRQWPKRVKFSGDGKTVLTQIGERHSPSHHEVVRLWDAATGDLRASTGEHRADEMDFLLSKDGSLLVTCSYLSGTGKSTLQCWNASNGQWIGSAVVQPSHQMAAFNVSPDGKYVLIGHGGIVDVFVPHDSSPPTRLPGKYLDRLGGIAFSPSGRSAITISDDAVHWWHTSDWQLHRRIPFSRKQDYHPLALPFISEDVLVLAFGSDMGFDDRLFIVSELSEPRYVSTNKLDRYAGGTIRAWPNALGLVIGSHLYDALNGQELSTPPGRTFHPDLSQLAADGRFALLEAFIVDVVADRTINLLDNPGIFNLAPTNPEPDSRFLTAAETWVAVDVMSQMVVLRVGRVAGCGTSSEMV
jgi:WD40 repeat protein